MTRHIHEGRLTGNERGFTIVELMIATMIFSTILLVITIGVLRFSSAYYKGVNVSSTQTVARTISDTVTQAVQFGSTGVTTSNMPGLYDSTGLKGLFCAGGYAFVYSQTQYKGGTPNINQGDTFGLFMMRMPTGSCEFGTNGVDDLDSSGQELLSRGMRVTNISLLNGGNGIFTFSVTVAYGENDLLCLTGPGCAASATPPLDDELANRSDVACRTGTGSEYCAVVTLNTSVKKRVASEN